jgi:hypothetical protein
MMMAVIMLIYTISLKLRSPTSIIIYNLCLNTELISPVYFGNGAVCPNLSDQEIDINTAMRIRFEIYATQDEFEGALLYRLQINHHDQYNMDTSTSGTHEAKYFYMLVAWKMEDSKLFVRVVLTEHTEEFTWNEGGLRKLYNKNRGWLKRYNDTISDTWIIDDNMTLKMTFKVEDLEENFELSISISEERRENYAMKPFYINLER